MTAFYPSQAPIDGYRGGSFAFASMQHMGALLALPTGMMAWEVMEGRELSPSDFKSILSARESVDFVLLGTGASVRRPPNSVHRAFAEARLPFDVMDTGAAVRTYNIVLAERRRVAAAFLPVPA
ncbi:MAG: Mth938-like domain-containing protein [Aestuariivirga sp.]